MMHRWLRVCWYASIVVMAPSPSHAVTLVDIIVSLTNWASCMDFQIVGPCVDPITLTPGIIVSYRLPHLLLDTVKIPGDSTIDELRTAPQLQGLIAGGGALGNLGEWNLQYSESHTVEWPMQIAMQMQALPIPPELWCLDQMQYGNGLVINFLSELDAPNWRANALPEGFGGWLGVWAPIEPRTGWCIHHSPSVASAVFGFRGAHIAWIPKIHVVLKPLWFALALGDDRMQLAVPKVRECIQIGQNPLTWDHGVGALDGKYLWVYWHRVSCCVGGVSAEDVPSVFTPGVPSTTPQP